MNIIRPKFEIWDQMNGLEGLHTHIERCGRVCYASEPKGNPVEFVERLKRSGHLSVLEHGTVYLKIPIEEYNKNFKDKYFPQK